MGLNRPNEGMIILNQVIEFMTTHMDDYKMSVEDEDIVTHLEKLRKSGWGGEPEINAMSRMFDVEFEIWVPDRLLGAATQSQYSEGMDRMALAHYPGVHYDYLHKLKLNSSQLNDLKVPPSVSVVDTNTTLPNVELTNEEDPASNEKDSKIRKIDMDILKPTDQLGSGLNTMEGSGSMTLEELVVIPPTSPGNVSVFNLDVQRVETEVSLPPMDGAMHVGSPIRTSTLPSSDAIGILENRELDGPEVEAAIGSLGNQTLVIHANLPTKKTLIRPGDPSLDISENKEGSTLNVNQEATGPK